MKIYNQTCSIVLRIDTIYNCFFSICEDYIIFVIYIGIGISIHIYIFLYGDMIVIPQLESSWRLVDNKKSICIPFIYIFINKTITKQMKKLKKLKKN